MRARELAAKIEDRSERFSVHYGQWAGCFVRAELLPMREVVQTLLGDCADQAESREAGVAYRLSGETNWFEGKFVEARNDLERALAIFDPERDRELAFRFGQDVIVTANMFLACVLWPLGEVNRARQLAEEMVSRAVRDGHIATIAWARTVYALFDVMFGNRAQATPNVTEMLAVAREHGMKLWMAFGSFLEPWTHSHTNDRGASVEAMRCGITTLQGQEVSLYGPCLATALAKVEAEAKQLEPALATIDRAIAEAERSGQRWYEAETHRIRGEILLRARFGKHGASRGSLPHRHRHRAAAEGEELRATRGAVAGEALSIYRPRPRRPCGAHAGAGRFFADTGISGDRRGARLLAALAVTDEVRTATAARRQRVELQVAYANALISARGHGAKETTAAFARVRDPPPTSRIQPSDSRFITGFGLAAWSEASCL